MGKKLPAETSVQKKMMIEALEKHFGNVTKAANVVGITPRTHYRWLKEDREYGEEAESVKDISFRKIKDRLLEKALARIDKGDPAILSRMLSIYCKNIPEEMKMVSKYNNVPVRVGINYVHTREQAEEIMRNRGNI